MAIVVGTNGGFVTTRPTVNPAGANPDSGNQGYNHGGGRFTSPAGNNNLTEIGFYVDNAVSAGNTFSVGLYAVNAGPVPGALLASKTGGTLGSGAGWRYLTLDTPYALTASTAYYIGVAIGGTQSTSLDATDNLSYNFHWKAGAMANPFGTEDGSSNKLMAYYGVYAASGTTSTSSTSSSTS